MAERGATLKPPFPFGAKVQKRLKETCELVRFYKTVGQNLVTEALKYDVVKNFTEQWGALKNRKEEEQPDVPRITQENGILFWTESMKDHLH